MNASHTSPTRLSRADREARAAMLDAFDAMTTSNDRHLVAGQAVLFAGLVRDYGTSPGMARVSREVIADWRRARRLEKIEQPGRRRRGRRASGGRR